MKELEQALIALAVIDKQVAEFLSSCGDEIFTEPVHRSIFNEIRSLSQQQRKHQSTHHSSPPP
jgi:replicative DNA helicase